MISKRWSSSTFSSAGAPPLPRPRRPSETPAEGFSARSDLRAVEKPLAELLEIVARVQRDQFLDPECLGVGQDPTVGGPAEQADGTDGVRLRGLRPSGVGEDRV